MTVYREEYDGGEEEFPLFNAPPDCDIVQRAVENCPKRAEALLVILKDRKKVELNELQKVFPATRGRHEKEYLVKHGHLIDYEAGWYIYRGFTGEMIAVTKSHKELYYASTHWRETSLARKNVDNWACRLCSSQAELETHHWTYNLFAEDVRRDLITFCRECHEWLHSLPAVKIAFPKLLPAEMIERIEARKE